MLIEADNLEIAYKDAVSNLQCSITQLDIKIVQKPCKGFLGFFKKNAIIEVYKIEDLKKDFANKEKIVLNEEILQEIKNDLEDLFGNFWIKITQIKVEKLKDNLVFIALKSQDDEKLIGKNASSYKALSYMLYFWLNVKYNLNLKFDIGNYLQSQKEELENYITFLIEKIKKDKKVLTKILDKQSIKIVLDNLRQEFPNKFIKVKSSTEGKFILIKSFREK